MQSIFSASIIMPACLSVLPLYESYVTQRLSVDVKRGMIYAVVHELVCY